MFRDKVNQKLKEAMKAKDRDSISGLRMILAAIKNKEIEKRTEIDEGEFIGVLSTLAKQRGESIDMYKQGGRDDLVQREEAELALIKSFLPKPLTEAELTDLIDKTIAETQASGPRDMGLVMKVLTPKVRGRADGKLVSDKVKARLS